jgi:hypothetical protein
MNQPRFDDRQWNACLVIRRLERAALLSNEEKEIRRTGLATFRNQHLEILDHEAMGTVAAFDARYLHFDGLAGAKAAPSMRFAM